MGKVRDLTGMICGRLRVIHRVGSDKHGRSTWKCECECGGTRIVAAVNLKKGLVKSCGCIVSPDLSDRKYNRLTVVRKSHRQGQRQYWECLCDCGNKVTVRSDGITSGHARSCGCIRGEGRKTHDATGTSTYKIWSAMKNRCRNKNYKYHNGRGVMYHPRWEKFENFLADMGERPDGLTIERVNNDWHYTPENCKWATRKEQIANSCKQGEAHKRPRIMPLVVNLAV